MFSVGDMIVYGVEGVCRVEEAGRLRVPGLDRNRDYYRLTPYYRGGTIYTPVDGRAAMRPVISRQSLETLIPRLPEIPLLEAMPTDSRSAGEYYRAILAEHNCERLLRLCKSLYAKQQMLSALHDRADFVVDTTGLSAAGLRERLLTLFAGTESGEVFEVIVQSFGFKYGIPADADLVYDVRCLPNPFYIDSMRNLTGLNEEVSSYVMKFDQSKELLKKLEDIIDFSIPLYRDEGKSDLVIAFGCTGGKHRSVTFAEAVYYHLKDEKLPVSIMHRDIAK